MNLTVTSFFITFHEEKRKKEKTMGLLKSSNYKTQIDHAPIHGGPEISQPPVFIMCDPDKEVAVPSAYNTGDTIKLINSCAHE